MRLRPAAFGVKAALARALGAASRATGRGGGTTLPGRILLRLAPDALSRLAGRLDPVTVVSATNGKTTTASLLAGALAAAGREPVHNSAGSNMSWGVATAMLSGAEGEGLFEVDEAWLGPVAGEIEPDLLVLGNLFRDQLDRHGELETLAEAWRELLAEHLAGGRAARRRRGPARALLNADDPLVADVGRDRSGEPLPGVTYFGVEDRSLALGDEGMAHDAKHCRRCGAPYAYEATLLGHLGHYRCPGCGSRRPEPEVVARSVELRGMEGSRMEVSTPAGELRVDLPLPGLYNAYNALAALAAALELGIEPSLAAAALGRASAVFGRVERLEVAGRELAILLIKNPTGATEVLRTITASLDEGESADLWIALNDGTADGHDISWIWDSDFEQMAGRVRRITCAGTRAEELALRLAYAGWPREALEVQRPVEASLDSALAAAPGRLFALPTYTALLELQGLLARRGLKEGYLR